jgi:two-component system chemotaxis sensor kinase CheA
MHLIRNSVDHGLETAVERVAIGKAPAGRIGLALNMKDEQLCIALWDDGRGLALTKIRQKAIASELITPDARLTAQEVAQLIFMPGFSTADQVTEVSGRGVGMDAVKGFAHALGGTISLQVLESGSDLDFVPFETVILLPGKFAVAPMLRLLQNIA